jgi:O-antigen/teichoic acid export membrane protein
VKADIGSLITDRGVIGAGRSLCVRCGAAAIGFGFHLAVARIGGLQISGALAICTTTLMLLSIVVRGGIDVALLRHLSVRLGEGDPGGATKTLNNGIRTVGVSALIASVSLWVVAGPLEQFMFTHPGMKVALRCVAVGILPSAWMFMIGAALQANRRPVLSITTTTLVRPAIALVLVVALREHLHAVAGYVLVWVLSGVGALLLAVLVHYFTWPRGGQSDHVVATSDLRRIGRPLMATRLIGYASSWLPLFVLSAWYGDEEAALFNAAAQLTSVLAMVLFATNAVIGPSIALAYQRKDYEAIGLIGVRFARASLIVTIPITALFLVAPGACLGVFGGDFVAGSTTLAVLAVVQFIHVATGSAGHIMSLSGQERAFRRNSITGFVVGGTLCFVLVPRFGALGGAMASGICILLTKGLCTRTVYQVLGIRVHALGGRSYGVKDH